jgi:hypothetical protein
MSVQQFKDRLQNLEIGHYDTYKRLCKFCENLTKPHASVRFNAIQTCMDSPCKLRVSYQLVCGTSETGFYGNVIIFLRDTPCILHFKETKDPAEYRRIATHACTIHFYNFEGYCLTNDNWEERKRITKKKNGDVVVKDIYCRYTE